MTWWTIESLFLIKCSWLFRSMFSLLPITTSITTAVATLLRWWVLWWGVFRRWMMFRRLVPILIFVFRTMFVFVFMSSTLFIRIRSACISLHVSWEKKKKEISLPFKHCSPFFTHLTNRSIWFLTFTPPLHPCPNHLNFHYFNGELTVIKYVNWVYTVCQKAAMYLEEWIHLKRDNCQTFCFLCQ